MIGISTSLSWVEAQDPPCKGADENQKRATTSLLSDFRPQKPQESNTTARRNTTVIYFNKNIYRHTNLRTKKLIKTSHTPMLLATNHMPEATKERPGPAPPDAGLRQRVSRTLDAARRQG
jgi:hypothetical protein